MTQVATRVVDDLEDSWDCQGENPLGCWIRRDRIEDVFVAYPRIDSGPGVAWELPACGAPEYCWPNSVDDLEAS